MSEASEEDGEIIRKVLAQAGKRSLFSRTDVPLGQEGWFIRVTRDWTDPLADVTDKIRLELFFNGPCLGDRHFSAISCESMLEVITNTSKLIEDAKKLKYSDETNRWSY